MIACQAMGVALGFVLPSFFFTDGMPDAEFRDNMTWFLTVQAGVSAFQTVLNLAILKEKPDTAPSPSAM